MTLSDEDFLCLANCAADAARSAGDIVRNQRPQHVERKSAKLSDASSLVTEVDRKIEKGILAALRPLTEKFDLAVLTEEQPDDGSRFEKDFFWCIDPLDGTLPFVEGNPGYAHSIALVARDGTPHVGVVYDPCADDLYVAVRGQGIIRNGLPFVPPANSETLAVYWDRSAAQSPDHPRLESALQRIAQARGLADVATHVGSGAVMSACSVLKAPPGCYFKFPKLRGGGGLWDFAATSCLFREAGAVATDIHGAPLDLNRPDSTFMNHRGVLFASDAELAADIRGLYAGWSAQE